MLSCSNSHYLMHHEYCRKLTCVSFCCCTNKQVFYLPLPFAIFVLSESRQMRLILVDQYCTHTCTCTLSHRIPCPSASAVIQFYKLYEHVSSLSGETLDHKNVQLKARDTHLHRQYNWLPFYTCTNFLYRALVLITHSCSTVLPHIGTLNTILCVHVMYRRKGNFRQLYILYFKFTFGFNFCIVRYACSHYSIAQKISFGFNLSIYKNKIHTKKTSPTVLCSLQVG